MVWRIICQHRIADKLCDCYAQITDKITTEKKWYNNVVILVVDAQSFK